MRLEERGVSGVGALQRRLGIPGHHHIEHKVVAILVGIHTERANFVRLLRLGGVIEGKAQEGGLAVCALDRRQVADLRRRPGCLEAFLLPICCPG